MSSLLSNLSARAKSRLLKSRVLGLGGFVVVAVSAVATLSGCEVTGGVDVGVPVGTDVSEVCTVPDDTQIDIIYQTSLVPSYLTISVNDDMFVYDECAPEGAWASQGGFKVVRTGDTEIQLGLPHGSGLRQLYFMAGESQPIRQYVTVKIMGRSSCYDTPTTMVPTTILPIDWQPTTIGAGECEENEWMGRAVIQ